MHDPEGGGRGPDPPWKSTNGYRCLKKFWYVPPLRTNWTPRVQLLLEGGLYDLCEMNMLMTKDVVRHPRMHSEYKSLTVEIFMRKLR